MKRATKTAKAAPPVKSPFADEAAAREKVTLARIAAEAPALRLTHTDVVAHPYRADATFADLIAFMHDSGHNAINVLENAIEGHLSELAVLQRMVCGKDNDRAAGSDEDRFYYFFEHMRARLEAAMILDERIKAANVRPVVAGGSV